MSIQRYTPWCRATHGHEPMKYEAGEFVLYSDYLSLVSKLKELEAELRADNGHDYDLKYSADARAMLHYCANRIRAVMEGGGE